MAPEAEKTIMYCARVSNSANQDSENTKLLSYCIKNGHWSIFEMGNLCAEIETSRAISAQILRHRSFNFQEFSQRYAEVPGIELYPARSQDLKNRQNSIDNMSEEDKTWFGTVQEHLADESRKFYQEALDRGVAKEQARMILPMASSTKLYMNGTVRSWIHYLSLRCENGTQKEHQDIAKEIRDTIFIEQFPVTSEALGWKKLDK